MKGQSKELVELTIVVVIIIVIGLITYFFLSSRTISKKNIQVEEKQFYHIGDVSKNIFYTKIPGIDKTLSQLLSDRMMSESDEIFYGEGYGIINVADFVNYYLSQYYSENWNLTVILILRNINPMWFPNSESSTISKVSSSDGFEMARYYTVPDNLFPNIKGNPSRIGVDSKGNAWIGNREYPSIVKIGLKENGQCVDKNRNGIIDTSFDKNRNGIIDQDEILPFNQDECILKNIEFRNVQGKYFVRAVCIDKNDNVYAGLFDAKKMFYIDGKTGEIIKEKEMPSTLYGCFVDKNNKVWFSTLSPALILYDPSTDNVFNFDLGSCTNYGISPCRKSDCMLVNCHEEYKIIKISTSKEDFGKIIQTINVEFDGGKGIITDEEDNIYTVFSKSNKIAKYDSNGNFIKSADTCNTVHGVGIDSEKKVWVACSDSYVVSYDENLNFLSSHSFGDIHYVYNFFTDYNVKINEIKNIASYGKNFNDIDPSRIRTFHFPIPLPGSSMYAEAILYVW
ncbi:MAG: hypothetical protein KQA41_01145 [Candidatus Aenigmarchaeota archaeon]|nr:hypothetical protein [Candidatus Aenigmarchaeota archaeon]